MIISVYKLIELIINKKIKNGSEIYARNGLSYRYFVYNENDTKFNEEEMLKIIELVGFNGNVMLKEDNPTIEKIEIEEDISCNKFVRNEYGTKCYIKTHDKIIIDRLNQVIDYIKKRRNNNDL